jgi:hypothetical protein
MVFERPGNQVLAVCDEGRGSGISRKSFNGFSVQSKANFLASVDTPASSEAVSAAYVLVSIHGSVLSDAGMTDSMSCVTVWRLTTNQRRQPSVCCQNSVWIPRGLLRV